MKKKLLFVITQFYKGGAETSLLNLFHILDPDRYEVDFVILNQTEHRDVTSLVECIPKWVQVYDAIKHNTGSYFFEQIFRKIYRRLLHAETYGQAVVKYIANKEYDVAFSFGEWLSPAFVANRVNAQEKYVWIHIDIDKADFVNKAELIKYDNKITGYIFASEKSMTGAVKCCTQMKDKSYVVRNFLNKRDILQKAEEEINIVEGAFLLSVGNLREEKNYPRQIEVMRLLKAHDVPIKWLCVGSTVNQNVYDELKSLLRKYKLEQDFILCGVDNNPYKYMKKALAVTVLSDHESWSLVISEAKILGVPVIATDTSGAQEQIVSGKTGIITSFEPEEIASSIETFINDKDLQSTIRMNLSKMEVSEEGLQSFEHLLWEF